MLDYFKAISLESDHTGLVWSSEVVEGKYLAELQTGILPQLVHLVIFDIQDSYRPVYETLQAFNIGDTLDESNMAVLQDAVEEGLNTLA